MNRLIPLTALATMISSFGATAVGQPMDANPMMQHGSMDSGNMMHSDATAGAAGQGVINRVDPGQGVVNITHGPIPALSWPEMTMDLPVAEGVELEQIQPGAEVRFRVVLGPDQVYRIVALEPTP